MRPTGSPSPGAAGSRHLLCVEDEVGQLPEGAVETVAWQSPAGSEGLTLSLYNGDLGESGLFFTLDELKDGQVMYLYETITAEEFEKERVSC